jgi:hypothetical protein
MSKTCGEEARWRNGFRLLRDTDVLEFQGMTEDGGCDGIPITKLTRHSDGRVEVDVTYVSQDEDLIDAIGDNDIDGIDDDPADPCDGPAANIVASAGGPLSRSHSQPPIWI